MLPLWSLILPLLFVPPSMAAEECDSNSTLVQTLRDLPPPPVYYGTATPGHVTLTDGQMLAIGTFGGCTGTLISGKWVLTADHCNLSKRHDFCIGKDPNDADICFDIVEVQDNRRADMTLVRLERDVRDVLPEVQPIPLFTDSLDDDWIGKQAEAAGYGSQEDGGYGEREFTAEPIVSLGTHRVTIDGRGERGVCFGDSGGPLMVIAEDGTTRVAGDLSDGANNCLGRDNYTRVDSNRAWIEKILGETLEDFVREFVLETETPPIETPTEEGPSTEGRALVPCPPGYAKYRANSAAFRDVMCSTSNDEGYVVHHGDTWWVWEETLNDDTMRFSHPETGEMRIFAAEELASVTDAGPAPLDASADADGAASQR